MGLAAKPINLRLPSFFMIKSMRMTLPLIQNTVLKRYPFQSK
jgi:hypothetical protein